MKKNCEIIAEIANAHQGKPHFAKKLASEAITNGADAVKFQVYFAEELLAYNHPKFKHFKNQSFDEKTWINLISYFKKNKTKVYCDIFGERAFKIAKKCNVDGYKIHSSDLNNDILLNLVAKSNKKIFLSVGGSTLEEIAYALKILKKSKKKPIILHGFQSYPTKLSNCDLFKIESYKKLFGNSYEIGYQDHLSADNYLNYKIPIIALGLGARYLEKHITLNRAKKGVDYYSSLEPREFKKFVDIVRVSKFINNKFVPKLGIGAKNLKLAMGDYSFESMSLAEIKYRENVKKVWFLKKKITKNQYIKVNNLVMKRPSVKNTHSVSWDFLKNKKTLTNIDRNTSINKSMFQNDVTVARSDSKRLKKKAIKKFCNLTAIEYLIKRVKKSKKINRIILCTTNKKIDDVLIEIAKKNKVLTFRGENKDVLRRMLGAIKKIKTDIVVRITGDDILIDPHYLDKTINFHLKNNFQYTDAKNLPSGLDAEIFDVRFLETISKLAEDTSETEYLTFYVTDHKNQFSLGSLDITNYYRKKIRLTLDNKNDFTVIKYFLEHMNSKNKFLSHNFLDLINFYKKNKKLFKINQNNVGKMKKINTKFVWKKLFF